MISPIKIWRRQKNTAGALGREGTVITWTRIHVPGEDFKNFAPFVVVLVEFKDKGRAFGQLVDNSEKDLKIGAKVKSVLRKVREVENQDVIPYGVKFKLL